MVINAQHLQITKKQLEQNIYYSHSGYLGGLKQRRWQEVWQQKPTFPIMHIVRLMLPKHTLAGQKYMSIQLSNILTLIKNYKQSSSIHKAMWKQ